MAIILKINDLSYCDFNNINLSFNDKTYYSVIGSNNCGKTTLFKLIAGIIPSNDAVYCNYVDLNRTNAFDYIMNLGIVNRVNEKSFIYQKVLDEMMYPLYNLEFSKDYSLARIKEVLELFNCMDFLNKNIDELNYYDKEILLIMIAILHKPKVLLLDSVLEIFPQNILEKIIKVFKKLKNEMTIISFTNSLDEVLNSDQIILLDKFKVIGEYTPKDIYEKEEIFSCHNLEIPFLIDLSIKLKMYNLVNKEYSTLKEMVDDLWP